MSKYIDADALNQDYQEWYKLFDWDDGGAEKATIARAIRILNDQPTADVRENVHGEWLKIHWKAFRCSECKRISEYYTDFCPNCGADMRKGENNGSNKKARCD